MESPFKPLGIVAIPCLRQKVMKQIPRSRQNTLKTIPYRAPRPRYGHIREYPPPPGLCNKLVSKSRPSFFPKM